MSDLKARRVLGGRFTADDTLELQFTYTGTAYSCVQHIEIVSGVYVTHGGGASAGENLHYKAIARDADGDGVIDYSSTQMTIVQEEKGTSVVKVVVEVILKSEHDAWLIEHEAWHDAYVTETTDEDGETSEETAAGAPSPPAYPTPTEYKSGEITLEWADDTFV